MRNIHILSTHNNKSKIAVYQYEDSKNIKVGELGLQISNTTGWSNCWSEKELYITSDEEIKEGGWLYNSNSLSIYKSNGKDNGASKKWKHKIILTTNLDLIKDGVQAIDDEFLEWFSKNQSCEEVEFEITDRDNNGYGIPFGGIFYKIIIPKEEPLYDYGWCKGNIVLPQETLEEYEYIGECKGNNGNGCFMDSPGHNCGCFFRKLKQETLEENSFTLLEKELIKEAKKVWKEAHPNPIEMALFGAEWQQERSYSEEDMKLSFEAGIRKAHSPKKHNEVWLEWFKQFKKQIK